MYFLTRSTKLRFPITPPPLSNHGNYIISLNRFVKWMAGLVEAEGVDIFTGFPGSEVLYDGNRIIGVRTGDRGIGKHGEKKPTFEPGVDVHAKVTILTDGVRGNLTKTVVRRLALDDGRLPQIYAIGIKELWEVPQGSRQAGHVMHTMGYPLRMEEFGGAFLYALQDDLISVGFVAGLDYRDPMFDPHVSFQHLKRHTVGERRSSPAARWSATAPRRCRRVAGIRSRACTLTALLIAGDAGGFVNSMRLKGIHLAMRTGMLAGRDGVRGDRAGDTSAARLKTYADAIDASDVRRELYPVRNVHQAFRYGLLPGVAFAGLSLVTGGWWIRDPMPSHAGHERMREGRGVLS